MLKSHYQKIFGALIFIGINVFLFQNCAQRSFETQTETQIENPTEIPVEEANPEFQINSKTTAPVGAKPLPISLLSKWTYETYVNPIPSNIFAANDVYAPHNAQVDFTGTFTFKKFNYVLKFTGLIDSTFEAPADWQIKNITLTKNGKKLTLDEANLGLSINAGFIRTVDNGFKTRVISVGSTEKFLMNWVAQINSPKSKNWQNMGAILVPRFFSAPWRGVKNWAFLEVKNKNQTLSEIVQSKKTYKDSNYKDNSVDLIKTELTNNFYMMSNKQVWLNFNEIEVEANDKIIDAAKACKNSMTEQQFYLEILKIPFPEIEKSPRKYFDMFHVTYSHNFSDYCPQTFFSSHGGGLTPQIEYPWLGPGAEITSTKKLSVVKNWDTPSTFAHEVGHGFGFADSYFTPIWNCPHFDENNIEAEQIFYPDKTQCETYDSTGNHNVALEDSMIGKISSYTVIHRALLGWLPSGSVKTIYKSGTYDIVSQNNDFSNPTGPQLLQVVINDLNGDTEFLYIELANKALLEKNFKITLPTLTEKLSAFRKSGIRIFGTNWRYRDHEYLSNNEVSYFDYKDINPDKKFQYMDRFIFTMPDQKTLNFKWNNTDVKITQYLDAKNPNKAKVKVEYVKAPY